MVEDYSNKTRLAKLLRFQSSNSDKLTSLDEYIERMRDKQDHIYYMAGNTKEEVRRERERGGEGRGGRERERGGREREGGRESERRERERGGEGGKERRREREYCKCDDTSVLTQSVMLYTNHNSLTCNCNCVLIVNGILTAMDYPFFLPSPSPLSPLSLFFPFSLSPPPSPLPSLSLSFLSISPSSLFSLPDCQLTICRTSIKERLRSAISHRTSR